MMRINAYTNPIQKGMSVPTTATESGGVTKHQTGANVDTVTISEEARQANLADQLEQVAGLRPEVAQKVASGDVTIVEPDWENYEFTALKMNPEPMLYEKVRGETFSKEFSALESQVEEYYAPILAKMEGMSAEEAMSYLFKTYKMPWLEDVFIEGSVIPDPPEGMNKQAADMAYEQLTSLFFRSKPAVVRDPYALGEEGIDRLDHMDELAKETAQAAYDAAQAELDAQGVKACAQRKEQLQQQIKEINLSGSGTCLGFLWLNQDQETETGDSP